jgi:hypothetical protein
MVRRWVVFIVDGAVCGKIIVIGATFFLHSVIGASHF